MYFAKYGSGENVFVGLHGWSGDHRTFFPLMKYLPNDAIFYSADLPGNGKSPALENLTLKRLVAEIAEGLHSLNQSGITMIGSCSGGLFALFVVKHLLETGQTNLIKRLVIIDPFAYFPWYFSVFVAPQMGEVGWYAYYTTFANPIGRWMTNFSLRKHRAEGAHLTNSFAEINHRVTHRYLQLLVEGGEAEQFSCITTPVVIVYGERTFSAVRKSLHDWKQILPQVSFCELKGAGHLPIEETPTKLANILFHSK
jgi:pimeloyl-ACP methyl ester carboxylesterase